MLKLGICSFEFSHHVVLIVVTIVAEYPGISALGKQVAKPDGVQTVSGSMAQTAAHWFSIFTRINQHSRRKARRNAPVHDYCGSQNRAFEALVQMAANLAW